MSALLVLALAFAQAQDTSAYAIVLTGAAGELETAAVGKLWSRAAGERLVAPVGYPKVVPADTIEAAPLGSPVALAGICRSKKDAKLVRDILRLSVDGVRVLPVNGQDIACPALRSLAPAPTKDPERIARRALLRGSAVAWELVSDGMTIITGKEKRYPDLRIRVWAGTALLDELTLIDAFDPTVNEGVGRGVTHMPVFIEAGDRSVLWVEHEKREDHRTSSHAEIFGFFDGKLRSFLLLKPYYLVAGHRRDWRALTLTVPGEKRGFPMRFDDRARRYCEPDACDAEPEPTPSPMEMPGCSDVACTCAAGLRKPVTLYEKPSESSPVVGRVEPGDKLDDDSLVTVVAKRGLARVRGKRVTYLGSFPEADGETFLILVGDQTKEVEADDIDKVLAEPVHEEWARLGANGRLGYTKALDAIVRGTRGDQGGCVPMAEPPR